jgi:hypothetical protein
MKPASPLTSDRRKSIAVHRENEEKKVEEKKGVTGAYTRCHCAQSGRQKNRSESLIIQLKIIL